MAPCGRGKRLSRRALVALTAAVTFLVQLLRQGHAARLYSSQEAVAILEAEGAKGLLRNSSSAWVVEFYSSWCGHCVSYAPTWKALARDVKELNQTSHTLSGYKSRSEAGYSAMSDLPPDSLKPYHHLSSHIWDEILSTCLDKCSSNNTQDV